MRHVSGGALAAACAAAIGTWACDLSGTGPSTAVCNNLTPVSIGAVVNDSISASRSCRLADNSYANYYSFAVTDSQVQLLATLSSPAAQAFLHLSDTTGFLLANSEYSQTVDTSATLRLFLEKGTYYLGVNSYATLPSGAFHLQLTRDSTPVRGCNAEWITPATSTAQTLTAADCTAGPSGIKYYTHVYLLVAHGNHGVTMTEHSTAFAPLLQIYSYTASAAVGESVLDSTNTNGVASLVRGADDLLVVYVGSSDSLQTGAYSLKVQ